LVALQQELEGGDSTRVAFQYIVLGNLARDSSDFEEALSYYSLARTWAPSQNVSITSVAVNQQSLIWQKQGLIDSALQQLTEVVAQARQAPTPQVLPAYTTLGNMLRSAGRKEEAMQYWQEGLTLAYHLQDTLYIIDLQSNIARRYREKGNYPRALQLYLESLSLGIALGNLSEQANLYNRIGVLHYNQRDYDQAINYYRMAFHAHRQSQSLRGHVQAYSNIGLAYLEAGQLDSARWYYEAAIPQAIQLNYSHNLGWNYYGLARIALAEGHYTEALNAAYRSLPPRTQRKNLLGQSYLVLGNIHRALQVIDSAQYYYAQARLLSQEAQDAILNRNALEGLSWTYQQQGRYDQALGLYQEYKTMADSLNNEENTRTQALLAAEYSFQMERDSIAQAQAYAEATFEKDLQQRQYFIILTLGGILGLVVLVLVVGNAYRQKRQALAELATLHEEVAAQRDRLDQALLTKDQFFSIISHDLRGPVNSFGSLAYLLKDYYVRGKHNELPALLNALETNSKGVSQLLDNLLTWALQQQGQLTMKPQHLPLTILVNQVMDIFDYQAKSKEIYLRAEIPKDLKVYGDENALFTILRNLVSNALKFTRKEGQVLIMAEATIRGTQIQIADTGLGMEPEKLEQVFRINEKLVTRGTAGEKGTGLGLPLVKEFTEVQGGNLAVESHPGEGTTFTLWFPNPKEAAQEPQTDEHGKDAPELENSVLA